MNRLKLCLKFVKNGHRAEDSNNLPVGIVCEVDGHRIDQMKCPPYRKLIIETSRTRPVVGSITKMSIKIIQTNLGRERAAHDLAYHTVKEESVNILLVRELRTQIKI